MNNSASDSTICKVEISVGLPIVRVIYDETPSATAETGQNIESTVRYNVSLVEMTRGASSGKHEMKVDCWMRVGTFL